MSIQSTQKLVLFIDEQYHNYTSGYAITDSSCYVIFDDVEQEYFVCGSRVSRETGGNFAEYHFYLSYYKGNSIPNFFLHQVEL